MEQSESVESSSSEVYLRFTALRSSLDSSEFVSFKSSFFWGGGLGTDSCVLD